jgi:hypothetical protein
MILLYVVSTWSIVELKMRFETWITWNDLNGIWLFQLSYLITLMAYLFTQRTPKVQIRYFIFEWSFDRLSETDRSCTRGPSQIISFMYVCFTWGIIELKTRFETWITRNDVNGVIFFTVFFNNSCGLPVFTMGTNCPNQVIYVCLFDLEYICAK